MLSHWFYDKTISTYMYGDRGNSKQVVSSGHSIFSGIARLELHPQQRSL
jgi:hypothetical protein